MYHLSSKEEDFCETTGLFGILLSITCLIQLFYYLDPDWITFVITGVYILASINFILILKKSPVSFILLVISTGLIFVLEAVLIVIQVFSTLLILLLLYMIVVLSLAYVSGLPKHLKAKGMAIKEEKEKWKDLI